MKRISKIVLATATIVFVSCQKKEQTAEISQEKPKNQTENVVATPNVSAENAQKVKFSPESKIVLGGAVEKTGGFADAGNLTYPTNVIVIDDKAFPDPKQKRVAFTNAIASGAVNSEKLTEDACLILLSGTVDLSDGLVSDSDHSYFDEFNPETHEKVHADFLYDVGSNKTIIGVENARVAYGGLRIKARPTNTAKNVIIRNIQFWDAHGSTDFDTKIPEFSEKKAGADQISVEGTYAKGEYLSEFIPENIWIDHCSFSDGVCVDLDRNYNHDGALDVKAVHDMTISWCEFTNHDKVTLVGSSDKFTQSEDRRITLHHNFYHGAVQRMPRSRGCQIHIYNNVYDQIGTEKNHGYSLGPGIGSLFIVENNFFGAHKGKILRYADKSKAEDSTFSKLFVSGNQTELDSSNSEEFEKHAVAEKPFNIPYEYALSPVADAEKSVRENAGAKMPISFERLQ